MPDGVGGMIRRVDASTGYALLDAGDGRRLERFADRLVDRPAPGATGGRRDATASWDRADLRFDRVQGWEGRDLAPWRVQLEGLTLELRPTDAGQIGVFPEHIATWPWLTNQATKRHPSGVLNLFAYTGATTLALARAGARVAHVDGARPAVAWARRNAALSGLSEAPIRWLVDDAMAFADRELRRGRVYRGVILDPPSYGHAAGRAWRLEDDLSELLRIGVRLVDRPGFILLTAHTIGWDAERLSDALSDALRDALRGGQPESGDLDLEAESGATLRLGAFARVIIE